MGTIFVSMMGFRCKLVFSLLFVDKGVNEHYLGIGRVNVVGLAVIALARTFIDLDTARLCQVEIAEKSISVRLKLLRWVSFDMALDEFTLIHNYLVVTAIFVLFIFENSDICRCCVPRLAQVFLILVLRQV